MSQAEHQKEWKAYLKSIARDKSHVNTPGRAEWLNHSPIMVQTLYDLMTSGDHRIRTFVFIPKKGEDDLLILKRDGDGRPEVMYCNGAGIFDCMLVAEQRCAAGKWLPDKKKIAEMVENGMPQSFADEMLRS